MQSSMRLTKKFFERPTLTVAKDLLGKFLVREIKGKKTSLIITEVEAYIGEEDLACHARFGRTKRTDVMYGTPAHWYVYLIYGLHNMLNVVTEKKNYPAAVLIRAGVFNDGRKRLLLNGPAKLTKALRIDRRFNLLSALNGDLYLEDRGIVVKPRNIQKGPRVGVDYAGEWKDKPWRFMLLDIRDSIMP